MIKRKVSINEALKAMIKSLSVLCNLAIIMGWQFRLRIYMRYANGGALSMTLCQKFWSRRIDINEVAFFPILLI